MTVSISWLPNLTGLAVNLHRPIDNRYLDSLGAIRGTEYKVKAPQIRCAMTVNEDGESIHFTFSGCNDYELMQLELLRLAIAFKWVPEGTKQLPMNRTARVKGKFQTIPLATLAD